MMSIDLGITILKSTVVNSLLNLSQVKHRNVNAQINSEKRLFKCNVIGEMLAIMVNFVTKLLPISPNIDLGKS